jgi:hypothetical protein
LYRSGAPEEIRTPDPTALKLLRFRQRQFDDQLAGACKMQLTRNAPLYSRQAIVVGHPIKGGQ